ncbi:MULTISPECIES: amidohydrolase [unclassified Mesorhizobium]|uniref:amidohydrolase family protein n=1 Tax=unclassified Mesorhizobium TaxID=325217 RepID=UPI000F75639B|nr:MULTISPECIES: amidohydrolase [unclassified Mesorhizobium]AZO05719.1 amidohydrolase [Mesorhizobium sp. M2A.F.Ca.ET.043.02.1.1]RUW69332.1 amidohydrolase [Mesorhizobium sp. M2A.F.Ca.ET.067.02.1.1]RWB48956.1 MAG: amidohydrolase [Mesorhizobium sp.]RWB64260.1 MAG: amidohydrolase [Mesorhizobium sp.]RWB90373.1 MAG: amidohydrolase [Mesorhizobium sp.]
MTESMILAGDHLLTMDATNSVIADGALLIEDGRIAAVGKLREIAADNPSAPVKKIADSVLMPGIVNAHAHSGFLRGTAEHLPVWDWLTLHINPMHRVLQPHEAEAASWLCYAESVLGGTTTVVDMWRFMEGSAKAAEAIGNRLVAVPYVGEHPDYNYFDTLDMNEAMIETWHRKAGGRVNVWVGLEHLFYADEAGQRRAVELAKKHGTGFHTHCSEAQIELAEFERRYGKRPMYVLDDLGFFETPLAMIAHGVWLDSAEIEFIAKRRVSVAHNPVSNMKLASGIALVGEMLAAGVAVGIGTDGEKENNNFDMFEEMKVASLLGKLKDLDAAAMDSWQVLRMATITGAKAIGLDAEIGSIEPGKRADIIAVRTDTPRMTPLYGEGPYFNLQHNLVHAVRGSDVAMTMIDGQIVVEDGELKTADLGEIIAEVRKVAPGLFARRAAFLAENADGIRQWTD